MAAEQRFLGEMLARRGAVPADRLEGLFAIQRRGTGNVGKVFGPVMTVWFVTLAVLGLLYGVFQTALGVPLFEGLATLRIKDWLTSAGSGGG